MFCFCHKRLRFSFQSAPKLRLLNAVVDLLCSMQSLTLLRPLFRSKDNTDNESTKDASTAAKRSLSNGVIFEDNTQCNFNPRNFKMLYVINSEKIFYRKLALRRAKEVRLNFKCTNPIRPKINPQISFSHTKKFPNERRAILTGGTPSGWTKTRRNLNGLTFKTGFWERLKDSCRIGR